MFDIFEHTKLNLNKKYNKPFLIINENESKDSKLLYLIAKFVLCLNKKITKCIIENKCTSCKMFNFKIHPDYYYLIPENQNIIKIDEVKKILEFISLKPLISNFKVVFINSIDKMNIKSYNSILKTLEEPKNNIYFLLSSKNNTLNKTILERCYILKTKNLNTNLKKIIRQLYIQKFSYNINLFQNIEKIDNLYYITMHLIKTEKKFSVCINLIKLKKILFNYKSLLNNNITVDISDLSSTIKQILDIYIFSSL